MIAQPVSIETGESLGKDIQWGGGHDSFYEVLPHLQRLIGCILSKHSSYGPTKKHDYMGTVGCWQLKAL
jgi:hypothetical protein